MRLIAAKDMGIAARDHGVGRRIKEYAVVADGKDAVEIVGDDHDGHAHVLLEFEDELVQQGGADRVEPGRRLVKENDFGVHRQRAGEPGAFAHTAADFGRVIILESGKADEREFEGGLFPDLGGGKLRIALQGQGHILGEGHGAPQRAALEEQAHAAEKFLALAFGPGPKVLSPVEHLPLCRLEQAHEDAQERAFAASARPHDDEYVLTVYREVEILLHDVAAVADRKVPRFDDGCGGIHIFKILQRMVRTAVDSTMPTME